MIRTIKVTALKPFDAGHGVVRKGDIIDIPLELLPHFLKHGKAAEFVEDTTDKLKKVIKEFKAKSIPKKKKSKSKK